MKRLIRKISGITAILLLVVTVHAELQLVDNFDGMATGNLGYGIATAGGGGIWSTNTGGTSGNIVIEVSGGSNVVRFMTTTDGTGSRGFGVAGIDNTIEDAQKGLLFFRFMIRVESNAADTYFGLHAMAGDTPFSVAGNDPENYLVAGFHAVNGVGTAVNLVTTRDAGAVLMTELVRGQWYNCWIDADHSADTFDLYISNAAGPAGEATLPTSVEKIGEDLPFYWGTTDPASVLTGAFFATPRLSSTTRSTTQSARTYIDEVYWDGDKGLISQSARNPVPANGMVGAPLTQILSWDAPDDPNISPIIGYDIYLDPNEAKVASRDPSTLKSALQAETFYDPDLDGYYDVRYFWCVDTTVVFDYDPNHTQILEAGAVWNFTTVSEAPRIDIQPVDVVVNENEPAGFTISVINISTAHYTWYRSADTIIGDDSVVGTDLDTLTLNGSVADEGYYYCKVVNNSGEANAAYSDVVTLGVKRKTALAHWTLDQSSYDAVNHQYLDAMGNYPATLADMTKTPSFVDGIAVPVADGAVAFDPNTAGVVPVLNPSTFTNQLTLSGWIKWDGSPLGEFGNVILQKGVTYETSLWLLKIRDIDTATGKAGVRLYNAFGYSANATAAVEANTWTHFGVTYDGNTVWVYIDGVLKATDSSGSLGTDTAGDLTLTWTDDFPGAIDDLQIFNYALDLTAIAHLYADVSGKSVCINPDDPILLAYDFDGNCIIDLGDFAELASHWMDCFLVPDCIERP